MVSYGLPRVTRSLETRFVDLVGYPFQPITWTSLDFACTRGDKVLDEGWYTLGAHVAVLQQMITALDLKDITLV
ncbi:MAG: hypothetical protein K2Y23_23805 [Cyanobacteria bacterium]|nr:hypothetical protein [Cyanobacteriota bacterium]